MRSRFYSHEILLHSPNDGIAKNMLPMKSTKNMPCISVTFTLRSSTTWLAKLSEHLSFTGICSAIHLFINPDSCMRCNLNDEVYSFTQLIIGFGKIIDMNGIITKLRQSQSDLSITKIKLYNKFNRIYVQFTISLKKIDKNYVGKVDNNNYYTVSIVIILLL